MSLLAASLLPLRPQSKPVAFRAIQPELFAAPNSLVNAAADIDGDGDLDLFVGFNGTANRLYQNDAGTFTDVAAAAGVADARATRAAAFGDWDGDGDADLLVGFAPGGGSVLTLYRNDRGTFTNTTSAARLAVDSGAVRQIVWVDYDGDDDLDLFVAFRDRANALFHNEAGVLTDIAPSIGLADTRRSVGAVWADLDADADLDVIVGNMDGDANGVFRNDGGRFTDVAKTWGLASGGRAARGPANGTVRPCVGDLNNDGLLDIVTANYGAPGLFLNHSGIFSEASDAWGINVDGRYDTCVLGDMNHDGALDLALTGQGPHALFLNALDASTARRSVRVQVVDQRGRANKAGAEVRVYRAGSRQLLGTALVDAGSGYNAQSVAPVHVGLASTGRVDIEVIWPANGKRIVTRAGNIAVDGRRITTIQLR